MRTYIFLTLVVWVTIVVTAFGLPEQCQHKSFEFWNSVEFCPDFWVAGMPFARANQQLLRKFTSLR